MIHKETGLTDAAQAVDHHFLLSGKPLEINMYDDDIAATSDLLDSDRGERLQDATVITNSLGHS